MSRGQCSTPGATQISGLHFRVTQGVRPRREWKQRPPLCSRVATGISWSSLSGLKGTTPPVEFGERNRDRALGHGGNEDPHLAITGESPGFSRAAAPVCEFSRGTTLGFQIDGDTANKRYWYYNVTANRPSNNGATIEASKTPQTETVNITASPRIGDKRVRCSLEKTAENASVYNNFFSTVYESNISG